MPEGHTIHRIARDHGRLLAGRPVAVSSPQGRFASDAALVDGVVLERIEPYGKHLFYRWANGMMGHVHLGLFGKFRVHLGPEPPPPVGLVRMRMSTDAATIDLAGPTACSDRHPRRARCDRRPPGPRPAAPRCPSGCRHRAHAAQQAGNGGAAARSVGHVRRRQRVPRRGAVRARHPPQPPGQACDRAELEALWATITAMLRRGVKDNRIVTIDRREFHLPRGTLRRGEATYVYHRDLCLRCGTPIQTVDLGGRPCYFCPRCQPS